MTYIIQEIQEGEWCNKNTPLIFNWIWILVELKSHLYQESEQVVLWL